MNSSAPLSPRYKLTEKNTSSSRRKKNNIGIQLPRPCERSPFAALAEKRMCAQIVAQQVNLVSRRRGGKNKTKKKCRLSRTVSSSLTCTSPSRRHSHPLSFYAASLPNTPPLSLALPVTRDDHPRSVHQQPHRASTSAYVLV